MRAAQRIRRYLAFAVRTFFYRRSLLSLLRFLLFPDIRQRIHSLYKQENDSRHNHKVDHSRQKGALADFHFPNRQHKIA